VTGPSSPLDDGGDGDKDVAQLVEDVGESPPHEVNARGDCVP